MRLKNQMEIIALALVGFAFAAVAIYLEHLADRLPPENRFRRWWRKWIIGDYPKSKP